MWINGGYIPTIAEAKQRLEYLRQHGETAHAFTFKRSIQPAGCEVESFAPLSLEPCRVT
jgi:hypothetical protein